MRETAIPLSRSRLGCGNALSDVSYGSSPTAASGEARGVRFFLCPPPLRGGKEELGAGSGNWRLAGRCMLCAHTWGGMRVGSSGIRCTPSAADINV